jgi:endonuclease YncB( thermonuclease family)
MKFLALLTCLLMSVAQAEEVFNVHDGDTFNLKHPQTECLTGRKPRPHQAIRLFGIDAPELAQPNGDQARNALEKMIRGQNVKDIETELVRQGWAYDSPRFSHGAYAPDQAKAQQAHAGVWQQPDGGTRPWDWRKQKKAAHRLGTKYE